jgi:hypothetical protein
MRTYEPTLSVSAASSDTSDGKVNFCSESETLQDRVDFAYRPRIIKGFVAKKDSEGNKVGGSWIFGCKIEGKVSLSASYEELACKVDSYMAKLCATNFAEIESDLSFAAKLQTLEASWELRDCDDVLLCVGKPWGQSNEHNQAHMRN